MKPVPKPDGDRGGVGGEPPTAVGTPDETPEDHYMEMLYYIDTLTIAQTRDLIRALQQQLTLKTWGNPLWDPGQGDSGVH
jgi:hypothetical protein